jgi:hypothetical protein
MSAAGERVVDLLDKGLQRAPRWIRTTAAARHIVGDLELRRRYGTGRRFTSAVIARMEPNRGHPMYDTWLDYALSSNLHGTSAVAHLSAHKTVAGARALDVGCAYAGFSIAFAAAGGERSASTSMRSCSTSRRRTFSTSERPSSLHASTSPTRRACASSAGSTSSPAAT